MTTLTTQYKFKVLKRLLKTKESFKNACSKSGLSIAQATIYLNNNK